MVCVVQVSEQGRCNGKPVQRHKREGAEVQNPKLHTCKCVQKQHCHGNQMVSGSIIVCYTHPIDRALLFLSGHLARHVFRCTDASRELPRQDIDFLFAYKWADARRGGGGLSYTSSMVTLPGHPLSVCAVFSLFLSSLRCSHVVVSCHTVSPGDAIL